MRHAVILSLLLVSVVVLSSGQSTGQSKKHAPSAMLASAQYVFVEPYSGSDIPAATVNPHVSAEDREAVGNVQNAILQWGQFKLAARRSEADLLVFIRKGRLASANGGVRIFAYMWAPAILRPAHQAKRTPQLPLWPAPKLVQPRTSSGSIRSIPTAS
jgi:hypothetical protein